MITFKGENNINHRAFWESSHYLDSYQNKFQYIHWEDMSAGNELALQSLVWKARKHIKPDTVTSTSFSGIPQGG